LLLCPLLLASFASLAFLASRFVYTSALPSFRLRVICICSEGFPLASIVVDATVATRITTKLTTAIALWTHILSYFLISRTAFVVEPCAECIRLQHGTSGARE
jgi:hypothetical protein